MISAVRELVGWAKWGWRWWSCCAECLAVAEEQLTLAQTRWIDNIYQASRRISRLNQGLLLLAKIENHQFADVTSVDLTGEQVPQVVLLAESVAAAVGEEHRHLAGAEGVLGAHHHGDGEPGEEDALKKDLGWDWPKNEKEDERFFFCSWNFFFLSSPLLFFLLRSISIHVLYILAQ